MPLLSMSLGVRATAAIMVALFGVGASAASLAEKFQPGVPYYFENFDPTIKPWDPGRT